MRSRRASDPGRTDLCTGRAPGHRECVPPHGCAARPPGGARRRRPSFDDVCWFAARVPCTLPELLLRVDWKLCDLLLDAGNAGLGFGVLRRQRRDGSCASLWPLPDQSAERGARKRSEHRGHTNTGKPWAIAAAIRVQRLASAVGIVARYPADNRQHVVAIAARQRGRPTA